MGTLRGEQAPFRSRNEAVLSQVCQSVAAFPGPLGARTGGINSGF